MLLADPSDFGPDGALYSAGYHEYPFFAERVNSLKQRFAPNGQKLLVVGAAFGYLVKQCVTAGYDAWGCDASQWALDNADPAVAGRMLLADATNANALDATRHAAGIKGAKKWDLLITEDLLPCLTDAEVQLALTACRSVCSTNLLHMVTPDNGTGDPRLNWKTALEWKAIVSPPDLLYDVQTDQVV